MFCDLMISCLSLHGICACAGGQRAVG